jgi:hypothetical protein
MIFDTSQPTSSYTLYSSCVIQEKNTMSFEDDNLLGQIVIQKLIHWLLHSLIRKSSIVFHIFDPAGIALKTFNFSLNRTEKEKKTTGQTDVFNQSANICLIIMIINNLQYRTIESLTAAINTYF